MRQLSRSYLQHGTRHLPTGSDPIPDLGGMPMMLANGNGTSLTGSNYLDLDAYITTDSNIYTLDVGTGPLSSTHAITIHQEGVYRVWFKYSFLAGTNGDTLEGSYDGGAGPNFDWVMMENQQDETKVIYDTTATPAQRRSVSFGRLFVIGGSLEPFPEPALPRQVFAQTANDTGGNSYDVEAWVLVERLGTSYTTNSVVVF